MARLFEAVTVHIHRDDEPCPAWRATPLGAATVASAINGTVQDSGGGTVTVLVDRATESYPELGAPVLLFHGAEVRVDAPGCGRECSEHHTFVPPCEQAIPPGEVTDTVYLALLGAREALCRVQTVLPVVSWRAMLGKAIAHIDYVGSRECGAQWSVHDRDDKPGKADGARLATAEDPGPFMRTTHGDDVVDAEIQGEFTDAQAAMVVALVAVCRATGATHSQGSLGFVRKAAELVRSARDSGTPPGWDEGDLVAVVDLAAK